MERDKLPSALVYAGGGDARSQIERANARCGGNRAELLSPVVSVLPPQLLAYHIADQLRNLARSVRVE